MLANYEGRDDNQGTKKLHVFFCQIDIETNIDDNKNEMS